jgi:TPR repeat protein
LKPGFFVVSGKFDGDSFYSRFNINAAGTTGFTFSWNEDAFPAGQRTSVLLSNLFSTELSQQPGTGAKSLPAEQGLAEARYNLGIMYAEGRRVPKDFAEAVKWYRKAAEQGHVGAQFNLGIMYRKGEGVPQDDAEAAKWFRMARAKACRRMTLKRRSGFAWPPNRAMPRRSTTLPPWHSRVRQKRRLLNTSMRKSRLRQTAL